MPRELPEDVVMRIRDLWVQTDPELSTNEIGRRVGRSKNSVVGIAHRNDFPAKGSPIKRGGVTAESRPPKRAAPQSALLALPNGNEPSVLMPLTPNARLVKAVPEVAKPKPLPTRECCWPIGQPGTSTFRFCDSPTTNRNYCDEHEKVAYVRVRDRSAEPAHA